MSRTKARQDATDGAAGRRHVPGRVKFLVCADARPQSRVAVRYACRRAKNTGGSVSLLHVIEPPEFQHWAAVGDVMENERRADAVKLLAPVSEDKKIDVLVVGAAAPGDRSFSLITFLAEKLLGHLAVPLVVVPGNLSDEQIANMT